MNSEKKVTNMEHSFSFTYKLPVKISDLLNTFVKNNESLGSLSYAFYCCGRDQTEKDVTWILNTQMPSNITILLRTFASTQLTSIGSSNIFTQCKSTSLTNIEGVFSNTLLTSIPEKLFYDLSYITTARYAFSSNK